MKWKETAKKRVTKIGSIWEFGSQNLAGHLPFGNLAGLLDSQRMRTMRKAMSKTITPPVGYKAVTGNCSLPEKIVNKKDNEIWLIRAPKDVWLL